MEGILFFSLNLLKSFYSYFYVIQRDPKAERMELALLQFLKHACRKRMCWQEERPGCISAEENCLMFVMEYNSYNSL